MVWLSLLCAGLSVSVLILSFRLWTVRRAVREICADFAEKLSEDTNTLISVSSRDRAVCRLADEINLQLRRLRKERHCYTQGDTELKNAVTNISHDLRTPLTAICGYLDLLEVEEQSEQVKRYLDVIRNRTEMLKQLTEELFRYSIITSPEYSCPDEEVAVNAVLEESIAGFYAVLQERGMIPEIRMPDEKVIVTLNRAALSRVFSNLLSNAMKYSNGDLEIELTPDAVIRFSNSASGLSEVQVGRLFDRFYTVEAARKSTGLGLAIVKTLVERMNGSISAHCVGNRLCIEIVLTANMEKSSVGDDSL